MRGLAIAAAVLIVASFPAWAQSDAAPTSNCASADPDTAIAGCTAVIQTQHQTKQMLAYAYNNRAWAYHHKGQDAQGLRDVDMALVLAPNNAAIIETRAEINEKLGKRDAAIADYRAALKLVPTMTQATDGLKRLNATP
ncbi:MAG TPA: hypothetical protein VEU53_12000 [Stellaceae bacterium]|nr:hypothetical protein [Stellaceae bacterium]